MDERQKTESFVKTSASATARAASSAAAAASASEPAAAAAALIFAGDALGARQHRFLRRRRRRIRRRSGLARLSYSVAHLVDCPLEYWLRARPPAKPSTRSFYPLIWRLRRVIIVIIVQ